MLRLLRLTDFVIVRRLEIDFSNGFNVLTGETGAGKSILIDGLGLLLGARADATFVRDGASRAEVSGEFQITSTVHAWLVERELLDTSDSCETGDPLLIRRSIDREGRSRGFVNDRPVTAQSLRELGEQLLDIHGQHASLWLTKPAMQRQLLDDFAQQAPLLAQVRTQWNRWQSATKAHEDAKQAQAANLERRERLEWSVSELDALKPEAGQWESLSAEHKRLANAASLIQGAQQALNSLTERDASIEDEIGNITGRLDSLSHSDEQLTPIVEAMQQAQHAIQEAASQLQRYLDRVDIDPARLAELDERIASLYSAARKYRIAPEELPEFWAKETAALIALRAAADLPGLEEQAKLAQEEFLKSATKLSRVRSKKATEVMNSVSEHLQPLGMKGAQFKVALQPNEGGPHGIDDVEFQLIAHSKSTPKPLAKIASGGELSRISLALAVVAAQANPVSTLIFDEADSGVGGAVAAMIGQMMKSLGQDRQVLCVTHAPQVASSADHHLRVSKGTDSEGVYSQIEVLDRKARIEEIARMLGGSEVTATTRKAATEMLG